MDFNQEWENILRFKWIILGRFLKFWLIIFLENKQTLYYMVQFSSVQFSCSVSCVRLFATPWIAAHQASLSITNSRSSPRLTSIESVMPSKPSHPLSSPSPAPNPSQHQSLFQWVTSLHGVAKVLEFQLQHQCSNEHPGLISFRMDWLDLLAVQGTLLQHSAFFTVQLSHPYMTTGKTIALTRQTFVGWSC